MEIKGALVWTLTFLIWHADDVFGQSDCVRLRYTSVYAFFYFCTGPDYTVEEAEESCEDRNMELIRMGLITDSGQCSHYSIKEVWVNEESQTALICNSKCFTIGQVTKTCRDTVRSLVTRTTCNWQRGYICGYKSNVPELSKAFELSLTCREETITTEGNPTSVVTKQISTIVDDTTEAISTQSVDTTQAITTQSADTTESITTQSSDTTESITTQSSDTTESITTQSLDTTESITTQSSDTTESVTTQSSDTTESITTQSSDTTESVTAQSLDTTEFITTQSLDTTESITTQSLDTTESITTQSLDTTESITTQSLDTTESITTQSADTTESITTQSSDTAESSSTQSMEATSVTDNHRQITTELVLNLTTEPQLTLPNISQSTQRKCPCACTSKQVQEHRLEQTYVEKEVKKIEKDLTVDKETLSSTVRKRTTAEDKRRSAEITGTLGIVLFIMILGSLVALDLTGIRCKTFKAR